MAARPSRQARPPLDPLQGTVPLRERSTHPAFSNREQTLEPSGEASMASADSGQKLDMRDIPPVEPSTALFKQTLNQLALITGKTYVKPQSVSVATKVVPPAADEFPAVVVLWLKSAHDHIAEDLSHIISLPKSPTLYDILLRLRTQGRDTDSSALTTAAVAHRHFFTRFQDVTTKWGAENILIASSLELALPVDKPGYNSVLSGYQLLGRWADIINPTTVLTIRPVRGSDPIVPILRENLEVVEADCPFFMLFFLHEPKSPRGRAIPQGASPSLVSAPSPPIAQPTAAEAYLVRHYAGPVATYRAIMGRSSGFGNGYQTWVRIRLVRSIAAAAGLGWNEDGSGATKAVRMRVEVEHGGRSLTLTIANILALERESPPPSVSTFVNHTTVFKTARRLIAQTNARPRYRDAFKTLLDGELYPTAADAQRAYPSLGDWFVNKSWNQFIR
uniref:Uncharacterized protein n=1 Tax=Mycena chlorophos TaxID=658473 RepID=A0ABQ0L1L2_MYCCL|nr:predicted protein [Mycena chlorophos]